jgi:menaquinone-dependent protoporphyrinogen IX oxidase
MKRIAVIYQSKYGATKQYAQWISRDLGAELLKRSSVSPALLQNFDVVVYGGGLYAGGIAGVDLVAKHPCPPLVVFTVGLANPAVTDYSDILNRNFSPEQREKIKVFHLRGAMDYSRLGPVHRGMMAMMKKMTIDNKAPEDRTDEDRLMLDTYGKSVDFLKEASILPLVEYVKGLL